MPRAKKTWAEKMKAKPPHHVVLDKILRGYLKGQSCTFQVQRRLLLN
jgi:hypothetical protein